MTSTKHVLVREVHRFFGLLFFATFFGTFISFFFMPRFSIGQHNFNTPGVLVSIAFFCMFIMVILKAIFKELPGSLIKLNFFTSFILFVFLPVLVGFMVYVTIYIPSSMNLLVESDFNNSIPLAIPITKDTQIYLEFNSDNWDLEGKKINITIVGPNNFNYSKEFTIAQKSESSRSSTSGNNSFYIKDHLPYAGQYLIIVSEISGDPMVNHFWVYGK